MAFLTSPLRHPIVLREAWTPLDIDAIVQYAADTENPYAPADLGGNPHLRSLEPHGDYRAPRSGRSVAFDKSAGSAIGGPLGVTAYPCTMYARMRSSYSAYGTVFSICASTAAGTYTRLWALGTDWQVVRPGSSVTITSAAPQNDDEYHDIFLRLENDTDFTLSIDGVEYSHTEASVPFSPLLDRYAVGALWNTATPGGLLDGSFSRFGIWPIALTTEQMTAVSNNEYVAGADSFLTLSEESGLVAYDITGNGNHGNHFSANVTHEADAKVVVNPANQSGYTDNAGVIIPRDESDPTSDAAGNALEFAGQCPFPIAMNVPCVDNHDGTVYLSAPHLTGSETVSDFGGSTTTPTVSAGRIDWDSGETLAGVTLSDGTQYVMQEGSGRDVYNVTAAADHATIVGGTIETAWVTTQSVKDWSILHGGRMVSGAFVPALSNGLSCADGGSIVLSAGKHGNANSTRDRNPFGAPELNAIASLPATESVGDDVIADTDYAAASKIAGDGDNRLMTFSRALTDAEKSQVDDYVESVQRDEPIMVQVIGENMYVRSAHSATHDKVEHHVKQITPTKLTNGISDFSTVRLIPTGTSQTGTSAAWSSAALPDYLSTATDDQPPFKLNNMFLAGAHGIPGPVVTEVGHGKTLVDVGSIWSDGAAKQWVLIEIVSVDDLRFVAANTGTATVWNISGSLTGNLTHVSGATETSGITVGSQINLQAYPIANEMTSALRADGDVITADGLYYCNDLTLAEKYSIVNIAAALDYLIASAGSVTELWLNDDSVVPQITHEKTKSWQENGAVVERHTYTFNQQANLNYFGGAQSMPISWYAGQDIYQHVPKTESIGGVDYSGFIDITSGMANAIFDEANWTDPNSPPDRMVQIVRDTDFIEGFAIGYSIVTGDGRPSIRKDNIDDAGNITAARKCYPYLADSKLGTVAAGTQFHFTTYRAHYLVTDQDSPVDYYYAEDDGSVIQYLSFNASVTAKSFLAGQHTGRTINVVEKSGSVTVHSSGAVGESGISVTASPGDFLVLQLV